MTVRELIEELSKMDGDRVVILQKDAEGNGYSPLSGADDNAAYTAEESWWGDVKRQTLTEEQRKAGYSDDDIAPEAAVPCVVLFPVN